MKISIIIPTYNRASLLPRAVRSVPKDSDTEIIIIDDGSADDTKRVVVELQKEDPRIIFIPLSVNSGVNYARNRGIEKATGEWISFLDSDDVYVPGGLGLVQAALVEVPADIDVVGFMTSRETGEGVLLQGGVRVDDEWSSYVPSYSDTLFKENIRGDINFWLRRSVFEEATDLPNM